MKMAYSALTNFGFKANQISNWQSLYSEYTDDQLFELISDLSFGAYDSFAYPSHKGIYVFGKFLSHSPLMRAEIIGVWSSANIKLTTLKTNFIISTEYLASQVDPRPILTQIRANIAEFGGRLVVIGKKNVVGFWDFDERSFDSFLQSCGFSLEKVGRHATVYVYDLVLLEKTRNDLFSISAHGVPLESLSLLYKKGAEREGDLEVAFSDRDNSKFVISKLPMEFTKISVDAFFEGVGIVELLRTILFYFPDVMQIEFSDESAYGFRLLQAIKTGALPRNLNIVLKSCGGIFFENHINSSQESMNLRFDQVRESIKMEYVYNNVNKIIFSSADVKNFIANEFCINTSDNKRVSIVNNLKNQTSSANCASDVAVVIPVFNTKLEFVADLLLSLVAQTKKPKKIIIVNDGSTKEYTSSLNSLVKKFESQLSFHIVYQENRGLASARNAGLGVVDTEYVFFLDSDDVILPNAIVSMLTAFFNDDSLSAVAGIYPHFYSNSEISSVGDYIKNGNFWRALGVPEARSIAMLQNEFICANACFRVKDLLKMGGWPEGHKSMWEDWSLFLSMAWSGFKFTLIPEIVGGYRQVDGSMSRTYNPYFGRQRIKRSIPVMTHLDADRIISLMHDRAHFGGDVLTLGERELVYLKRRVLNSSIGWLIRKFVPHLLKK